MDTYICINMAANITPLTHCKNFACIFSVLLHFYNLNKLFIFRCNLWDLNCRVKCIYMYILGACCYSPLVLWATVACDKALCGLALNWAPNELSKALVFPTISFCCRITFFIVHAHFLIIPGRLETSLRSVVHFIKLCQTATFNKYHF